LRGPRSPTSSDGPRLALAFANGVRFPLAKPGRLDFDNVLWWRDIPDAESHQADREPLSQRLRIETFGHFAVRYGGRDVVLNGRKARALLGYLALAESGQETRERLVGLLWSETEETKARASLRQTLYEIREAFQAVGFDKFDADKHVTRIDRDALEVDLWDVMGGAKRGEPHALLLDRDRITEGLLNELESVDPAFRSWLLAKRQSLHDRLVAHLEDALHGQTNAAASGGEGVARALMKLDPTHEEAARALIRARVAAGDVGNALGIYKALWKLLEDEYDVEPSKETQELIAAVKLGQLDPSQPAAARAERSTAAAVAQPRAAVARKDSDKAKLVVAVAGFDAIGTREQNRYLVQGFRRELIASLVRFREWVVRDQGHVAAGATPSNTGAGEYVIDASAFESDETVRLVLMLRNAETNDYLWSERLHLSALKWSDAQQAIVSRLALVLNVHISAERLHLLARGTNDNLDAYDQWLQGQALLLNLDPTDWHKAADIFQKIIGDKSTFAPAYSSLAQLQTIIHFAHPGVFRDRAREDQALFYAREATRLDPIDSRAHLCLGWAYTMAKLYDQGSIHHGLAKELNENDPWTLVSAALGAAFRGEKERARQLAKEAMTLSLDPSPIHWGYQTQIRFLDADYDGAIEAGRHATIMPVYGGWRVAALVQRGCLPEARKELEHFFATVRDRWFGAIQPTPEAMTRWFLHSFPIRYDEDWRRLRDGLGEAGAPVSGLEHHAW
jgi:DNA-binding SARP family transcriptional activator